jgi:hypothetical protein
MTLIRFQSMSQHEQCELTLTKGVQLADRYKEDFTLLLYQFHTFYVELYYHTAINELVWVNSFDSTAELDPYLGYIDLKDLV